MQNRSSIMVAGWVFRRRRLLVLLVALLCAGAVAVEPPVLADELTGRAVLGAVLLAAGNSIRFWATWHIAGRKSQHLITGGPYAFTRNPLYLGSALAVAAAVIGLAVPITGMAAILALLAIYAATVLHEEERLASIFGEPYRAYLAAVPRFRPRLTAWRPAGVTPATATDPAARRRVLWREAYTALGFLLAAVGAFAVREWLDR